MLFSCKNDMEEVNRIANDEILPEMTGHNLEMIYSDSARIKYKVITPEYLKMSEGEEKYEEFPQGLHAISYDTDGKEIGSITCKYAKKLEEEQLWEARNEVVVINSEGKKLETELLYWDTQEGTIYSDRYVKLTADGQVIDESMHLTVGLIPDPAYYTGVEDPDAFVARISDFMEEMKARFSGKDGAVMIAGHKCTTGCIDCWFSGMPADGDFFSRSVKNGKCRVYEI